MTPPPDRINNQLNRDPELVSKLVQSYAPDLIGLTHIVTSLLLQQTTSTNSRDHIHILLVGDYGTGKTHLINTTKQQTQTNPKYHFIDNLNTLSKDELRELENLMEGPSGVSVLAASSPRLGNYNTYQTIRENIALPGWLLASFDLIYVIRDNPDPAKDRAIAEKILNIHQEQTNPALTQQTLREHLEAATKINPEISHTAKKKLLEFYLNLRKTENHAQVVAITPRQLKTLIKLSKAYARLHHRETVLQVDAEAAIHCLLTSLEQVGVDPWTRMYDIDSLYSGRPTVLNSKLLHLVEVFGELEKLDAQVKDSDLCGSMFERYGYNQRTVNSLLRTLVHEEIIIMDSPGVYIRVQ